MSRRDDGKPVSMKRLTRAQRSAHTRRDLLEAAERRFFVHGYHGTTLDDIADEAGYTKGAV
ncbi:MAG TPA: TetR family transcriptional regulator, partial [Solirubrobacteraceae bacterium]|nr:TetR family transcriptional regulator [Solirubrobacteraceae bacterium]